MYCATFSTYCLTKVKPLLTYDLLKTTSTMTGLAMTKKKKTTVPDKTHALRSKGVKVTKPYELVPKKIATPSSLSEFTSTSSLAQPSKPHEMSLEFTEQQEERTLTSMNMAATSTTAS